MGGGASWPLPRARHLPRIGLELLGATAGRLSGASAYVALVTLALLGPLAVGLIAVVADHPELGDVTTWLDPTGSVLDPLAPEPIDEAFLNASAWLSLGMLVASIGVTAMSVESQALAAALLGGVAVGRPLSMREALRRSRQVFWRVVGYAMLTAVPIGIITGLLSGILTAADGDAPETISFVTTVVGAILGLPFVYGVCGIVLGDVGVVEAIRRSIRLARARWRLAIALTIFTTVAWYVAALAYLGAVGLVVTVAGPLGVGFDNGPVALLALVGVALALSAAFGSLLMTVTAIVVAPQVVAFLGLTHYAAGLDRARDSTVLGPPVRLVTLPLAVGIACAVVAAIGAVAALN